MSEWTQSRINELARELGSGPESVPYLWKPFYCSDFACQRGEEAGFNCVLPPLDADTPDCALWVGLFMRAMNYPIVKRVSGFFFAGWLPNAGLHNTPALALHAVWEARKK